MANTGSDHAAAHLLKWLWITHNYLLNYPSSPWFRQCNNPTSLKTWWGSSFYWRLNSAPMTLSIITWGEKKTEIHGVLVKMCPKCSIRSDCGLPHTHTQLSFHSTNQTRTYFRFPHLNDFVTNPSYAGRSTAYWVPCINWHQVLNIHLILIIIKFQCYNVRTFHGVRSDATDKPKMSPPLDWDFRPFSVFFLTPATAKKKQKKTPTVHHCLTLGHNTERHVSYLMRSQDWFEVFPCRGSIP